jgi:hypothetical protein
MAGDQRLSRVQLMEKLAALDREALQGLVWTAYWRGGSAARARIEESLDPEKAGAAKAAGAAIDVPSLALDVGRFDELARSGAYWGGSREVSPKERRLWRVTFRGLLDDATALVERGAVEDGAPLLAILLDLANDSRGVYRFHSEDPVAALKLVFSDRVGILWRATLHRLGFDAFATSAAVQIIRWEAPYGWTNGEVKAVREKETTLTALLKELVHGADAWLAFARAHVQALDRLVPPPSAAAPKTRARRWEHERKAQERARGAERRAERLAELHTALVDALLGTDGEGLLEALARHAALGGPERTFIAARLAAHRGRLTEARALIERCLAELPGRASFLDLATKVGAQIPPHPERTIVILRR